MIRLHHSSRISLVRLLSQLFRSFARHESGSIAMMFGLMTFLLFAVIGAAVDYGKWHNAHLKVEAITDRALLAAGRHLQTEPGDGSGALAVANTYFNEAIGNGIYVTDAVAEFKLATEGMGIEATVTGLVKTPFLSLINIQDLAIFANSKVEFNTAVGGSSAIEVALMLDVTGSMCGDGIGPCTTSVKMDALKTASKDLVSVLVRDGQSARVALIPFSTRVRVGEKDSSAAETLMTKLTGMDPVWSGWFVWCNLSSSVSGGSETAVTYTCGSTYVVNEKDWTINPCVSDRNGPEEFTDVPPGPGAWLNAHDGHRHPISQDSLDTPYTSWTGTSEADPSSTWNYAPLGQDCGDTLAANIMLPLTSDVTAINARIDALDAYGSTGGALGTAWAWYALSPNWSGIFEGASAPASYSELTATTSNGAPKLRKIAVLMTDGDYNTYRAWKGYDPQTVSDNAKAICTNMKAKGIEVFTVGFDLDKLPSSAKAMAIDTLQSCGTDIEHFYNSLDADQLKTAFRDIAMKLSVLYLAK